MMKLAIIIISLLFLVCCEKTEPSRPQSQTDLQFRPKFFLSANGKTSLRFISKNECESTRGGKTLVCKYSWPSENELRVAVTVLGSDEIIYYQKSDNSLIQREGSDKLFDSEMVEMIRKIEEDAAKGDSEAQFKWGREFSFSGTGMNEKDSSQAALWFEKAAMQGHKNAAIELAKIYLWGSVLTPIEARADGTVSPNYLKHQEKVIGFLNKFAENGDPNAQNIIGLCFAKTLNYPEAVKWWTKSANQGFSRSMIELGDMEADKGGDSNNGLSFEWYMKAARIGDRNAVGRVAKCYVEGRGVEKNVYEGLAYAKLGNEMAGDAELSNRVLFSSMLGNQNSELLFSETHSDEINKRIAELKKIVPSKPRQ